MFDSLQVHLPKLTLRIVLDELERWRQQGVSCFRRMVESLNLPPLSLPGEIKSPLDLLVPLTE